MGAGKRSGGRVAGRTAGRGNLGGAIGRGTLSREVILRAAIRVVDRDGLNGLTMRKLAAGLGASPMALYRYFRNKEELVDGLVDVVVGDYEVTEHDEADRRDWLCETFRLMHQGLCEHPAAGPPEPCHPPRHPGSEREWLAQHSIWLETRGISLGQG